MNTYNKIILGVSLLAVSLVVCLNVALDIHRIFGIDRWNKVFVEENQRFSKTEHLKSSRKYDAFIFGSSRANFYSARFASELSGRNFYNYSSPAEKIDRILQKLAWLKRNNIPVKEVVIALDFDFMFLADDLLGSALATKEHPEVSGETPADFYVPFLFQFDWKGWKRFVKIKTGHKAHDNIRLDLQTGNWYYPKKDEQIAQDPDRYLKEEFPHKMPYEQGTGRVSVNMERLKALIGFLDRENIPRIILINPYYSENFKSFKDEEYGHWVREVVSICGEVWDFSGLNKVTQDPYLYYDMSHFRYPVGDRVLERIQNNPMSVTSPGNDFGVLLKRSQLP